MDNKPTPKRSQVPAPYPPKDHWDYYFRTAGGIDVTEILAKTATPEHWVGWSQAFFYAGTTLHLWNEATELKIAFLSACSLRAGQKVFLIGKYAFESGLTPALESILGEKGSLKVEEISSEAIAAFSKVRSTPGTKLQWNFHYLDSVPNHSLDRVILFGAASHIANWNDFARQINRVLRDGGKVIIAEAPLGGKEFRYAMHMDAHPEGFLLRTLSGMGIKEEELPDIGTDELKAIFQPLLRWSRSFCWQGLYLFYGQKDGKEESPHFRFPKSTEEVATFLTAKPRQSLWDFITEPEKAVWGPAVAEINKRERYKVMPWGGGNLMWIFFNNRSITDIMWSNLMVSPGDKVLFIGERPEELGTLGELKKRVGETGEIVCVNMSAAGWDYKGWQKKRQQYIEQGCGEEWPYEFADAYPDNYFDLIILPQGVHHSNNWLRDAPRLLRTLKQGRQFMAIECGINRPEFAAAREMSALMRLITDRIFYLVYPPEYKLSPDGDLPLSPGCEHTGRPHHDVPTAHLRQAFGDSLTDVYSLEWKGWILFWGYKK